MPDAIETGVRFPTYESADADVLEISVIDGLLRTRGLMGTLVLLSAACNEEANEMGPEETDTIVTLRGYAHAVGELAVQPVNDPFLEDDEPETETATENQESQGSP